MHGRSRRTPSCRGCSESVPSSSPGPRSTRRSSRPRSTTAATPGGRSNTARTARAGASWTPIAARLTRPERGACAVLPERGDHALAERRQRLGRGEVGEPGVDALDALFGETAEAVDQLGRGTDDRPDAAEPTGRQRGDIVAVVTRIDEGDHLLHRHTGVADLRPQLLEVDARAGLHIAPVGEVTHERQRLWPRAADDYRDPAERRRLLAGALHVVEIAVIVDDLARPQRTQDLEGLAQPLHPVARLERADAELRKLLGPRAPPDAELEAAAGCVVDRHRLTSEDGRVPERVAQHERADPNALGMRRDPC